MKSENSVQYSILDVQYDEMKQMDEEGDNLEPPPLMMNKISKSENTNPQIVVTSTGMMKTIHKTKTHELVEEQDVDQYMPKSLTTDNLMAGQSQYEPVAQISAPKLILPSYSQHTRSIKSSKENGKKKIN